MPSDPSVLLIGQGTTALSALQSLLERFEIAGLVRNADAGDPVVSLARVCGVPVFTDTSLNGVHRAVTDTDPDAVVVSSYDRILPAELITTRPFVNVHYAELPRYRGRATVNWAIINGEPHCAISVHCLAPGLDAGGILFQQRLPIGPSDTVTDLYDRLNAIQRDVLADAVARRLRGDEGEPQDERRATYGCTRLPEDGEIDWSGTTEAADRLVRALTDPFPGAFTWLGMRRLVILRAEPMYRPRYEGRVPGRVVGVDRSTGVVDVLTGDGVLRMHEVAVDGAGPQRAADVITSVRQTLGLGTARLPVARGQGGPDVVNDAIPLVDLGVQHQQVADEVHAGFGRVLARTSFVLGPEVEAFERRYAEYCGAGHCIGVGNGTDAIELALRAVGVGPGDEVITAANTFVATAEAIARTGATLVLADCDEHFLLDPAAAAAAITSRTKAIVPVHLYGQMAPTERYLEAGVTVVEDAAQSQGAVRNGHRSGSVGTVGATSFYPGKNLGAYGDAGAVTTSDAAVAERLRAMRNHGGVRKYEHVEVGINSRLDELQAVVLAAKLRRLDEWNDERRLAAERYGDLLKELDEVGVPGALPGNEHVWHLYVVRVPRRDDVLARLTAAGVGAGVHYPVPVHLLPAFADRGWAAGAFPMAERLAGEILSLPIYPGITPAQQERVVQRLAEALK